MLPSEISRQALTLPPEERLELARRLVESVATPESVIEAVEEGAQRIDGLASGRVTGLTEEQFRRSLQ